MPAASAWPVLGAAAAPKSDRARAITASASAHACATDMEQVCRPHTGALPPGLGGRPRGSDCTVLQSYPGDSYSRIAECGTSTSANFVCWWRGHCPTCPESDCAQPGHQPSASATAPLREPDA